MPFDLPYDGVLLFILASLSVNAGIYLFTLDRTVKLLREHYPEIHKAFPSLSAPSELFRLGNRALIRDQINFFRFLLSSEVARLAPRHQARVRTLRVTLLIGLIGFIGFCALGFHWGRQGLVTSGRR